MPSFLKKKKNLTILLSLVLIQMILISIQAPLGEEESFFKKMLLSVFIPVQDGVAYFFHGSNKFWRNYFFLHGIQVKNNLLQEKYFLLKHENELLRKALKKYQAEKEVEDIFKQAHKKIIAARIIGLDARNIFKSININKGSADGVKKDMVVLDLNSNLVGRIITVTLRGARIQLLTDNDAGVSVSSEENKSIGVLSGSGSGLCQVNYILNTDKNLDIGNIIITTGYDEIYPPGIRVGEIISIENLPSLFKMIIVKPYFNLSHSKRLAVIGVTAAEFY
jgi:rod shape-determining protein MreC